jgi:tetratricopeptide (TPR) repeat protein
VSGEACPNDDEILDLVEGRVGATARGAMVAHLDGCDACHRLVADALRVLGPAGDGDVGGVVDRIGRYRLLRILGIGASGVVYDALDPPLGRHVALKLLRPSADADETRRRERLVREGQAAARIAHPNVVTIYTVGAVGDRVYIAMELVDGPTLRGWLRAAPRSVREVATVLAQAGRGLQVAHRAGMVHRDFKPENVLVGSDGRVRVSDFGLARLDDEPVAAGGSGSEHATVVTLTRTGALLGTPAYMAPEQLRGRPADTRSDAFAFAVTLHEALFGVRPFAGDSVEALADRIERGERVQVRGPRVGRALAGAIARGLRADPARRAGLDELVAALEAVGAQRPSPRQIALAVVTALILVGAAALGALRLQARRSLCAGAERHLDGIWDAARRAALDRALTGDGTPARRAVARAVAALLDGQARGWVTAHVEACTATRLRGDAGEAALEARMACLDERRRDLSTVIGLVIADPARAAHATEAVAALDPAATCLAPAVLRRDRDPPDSDELRAAKADLAEARARMLLREPDAAQRAQRVTAAAERLGARRLLAQALMLDGSIELDAQHYAEALALDLRALTAAASLRDERLLALAWINYATISGSSLGRTDEGLFALEQARRTLPRADPELEARRLIPLAAIERLRGHLGEARRALEAAVAGLRAMGDEDPRLEMSVYVALADVCDLAGDFACARAALDDGEARLVARLGASHPLVDELRNLTAIERLWNAHASGAHADALRLAEEELRRLGGPAAAARHVYEALTIGIALMNSGHAAEAVDLLQATVAFVESARTSDDPDLSRCLIALGAALRGAGRARESIAPLERALRLRDVPALAGSADLASAQVELAMSLWVAGGHRARALDLARRARAAGERLEPSYDVTRLLEDARWVLEQGRQTTR